MIWDYLFYRTRNSHVFEFLIYSLIRWFLRWFHFRRNCCLSNFNVTECIHSRHVEFLCLRSRNTNFDCRAISLYWSSTFYRCKYFIYKTMTSVGNCLSASLAISVFTWSFTQPVVVAHTLIWQSWYTDIEIDALTAISAFIFATGLPYKRPFTVSKNMYQLFNGRRISMKASHLVPLLTIDLAETDKRCNTAQNLETRKPIYFLV